MSTDNRTMINDCLANTGWTGDDTANVIATAGSFYEGTDALATQLSNVDEQMNTTQDSVGATTFSLDWSDSTLYMLIKDNLNDIKANGGVKFVIGDGVDLIGYEINGNDVAGLALQTFFIGYRLDVSNSAVFTPHLFSGTEAALDKTAITQIGYGSLHLAKAVGSIDNVIMDAFRYMANGSPALTINVGTVGTPETLTDVAADDVTNGWGMVTNPQGNLFNIAAPTEWGDSGTADSFFEQLDSQIYLIGTGILAGNFDFGVIANSTGTNLFRLDGCTVVSIGAVSNWDFNDINVDTLEILSTIFIDNGSFVFPVTGGTSRKVTDSSFINCGQVDPSTMTFQDNTFNGTTDANGAILLSSTTNISGLTFVSDGTGHAIYITATGSYDLTNFSYTGYGADATTDAVVHNNSGGLVTLNIAGGDTPTVLNITTSTTTINNSVTVRIQGVTQGAACKVIAKETVGTITTEDVIFELLANSLGVAEITNFNYEAAFDPSGLDVEAVVRSSGLPSAAIQDDNASYTDETSAANSNTVDDMNLLPVVPVANQDAYLFGHAEQFAAIKLFMSTIGTGGFTITWQYWNGAWTNLSGVVDDTSSFSVSGENKVTFTLPVDWITSTINGQGAFYYMRALYSAGTVTIVPKARVVSLNVNRYLPFDQDRIIESTGLTVNASWSRDKIARF